MAGNATIVESLTQHLSDTKSLREGAKIRRLRAAFIALDENENWLSGKIDPLSKSDALRSDRQ